MIRNDFYCRRDHTRTQSTYWVHTKIIARKPRVLFFGFWVQPRRKQMVLFWT